MHTSCSFFEYCKPYYMNLSAGRQENFGYNFSQSPSGRAAYSPPRAHKLVYPDPQRRADLEKVFAPQRRRAAGRLHGVGSGRHGGEPLPAGRGRGHARIVSAAQGAGAAGAGGRAGRQRHESVHPAGLAAVAPAVGGLRHTAGAEGADARAAAGDTRTAAAARGQHAPAGEQSHRGADLCRQRLAQPDGDPHGVQELHRGRQRFHQKQRRTQH